MPEHAVGVRLNYVVVDQVAPVQAQVVDVPADPDAALGEETEAAGTSNPVDTAPAGDDSTQEDSPIGGDAPADENPGG